MSALILLQQLKNVEKKIIILPEGERSRFEAISMFACTQYRRGCRFHSQV